MLTIKAGIFIWDNGVGHWTSWTRWQYCILITKWFWSDWKTAELHLFGPFTIDDQMWKFIIASSCCFISLEFGGYFGQRVINIWSIYIWEFVSTQFCDDKSAGIQNGVQCSIRASKERCLNKFSNRIIYIIHLRYLF